MAMSTSPVFHTGVACPVVLAIAEEKEEERRGRRKREEEEGKEWRRRNEEEGGGGGRRKREAAARAFARANGGVRHVAPWTGRGRSLTRYSGRSRKVSIIGLSTHTS